MTTQPTSCSVDSRTKQTIFEDLLGISKETCTTRNKTLTTPHGNNSRSQSSPHNSFVSPSQVFPSHPAGSFSSTSTVDFEPSTDQGYDSDLTDFLETAYTPCPARRPGRPRRQTGLTSHFLVRSKARIGSLSVRRKLDFGKSTSVKPAKPKHKVSKMGLALEHVPRHSWSSAARQLLLVFYRWYDTEDRSALNVIFNHIMGWTMKDSTIVSQFSDMKGDGPKACWEWGIVFDSVAFDDRMGRFVEYRKIS
jgi:hypothetical protein